MKNFSRILQSIASLWLAVGFSAPLFGGVLINSYRFSTGGGGSTDPYFASVVLLLQGNGTNGATTSIDQIGHTSTNQGAAQLSTSRVKFGSASMRFDGSSSAFTYGGGTDWYFTTGDFTIELFCNFNSVPTSAATFISNYSGWSFQWRNDAGAGLYLYYGNTQMAKGGTWTPSTNVWYYLAVKRTAGVMNFWIDGVKTGTDTTVSTSFIDVSTLAVGALPYTGPIYIQVVDGWFDEVRVTKGVARDVSSVPTSQFPDS